MSKLAIIKEATTVWNYLHGIICIYKPLNLSSYGVIKYIKPRLCADLNAMSCREVQTVVQFHHIEDGNRSNQKCVTEQEDSSKEIIARINDGSDIIEIVKGPSYSDHPLVVGPRYQQKDIKMSIISQLGKDSSGVTLLGLMGEGGRIGNRIYNKRWIRTYIVSGRFGIGTNTQFHTGKIIEKSTYHNIKKYYLDRLLCSSQASHQRTMFQAAGVQLNSERAYELASRGLIRPDDNSEPIIYSLKCITFDLPNFDIEVQIVNENEDYLKTLIHQLGLRLRSTATCTKIRCIKYGPFTLHHSLLRKHWDIENIVNNLSQSAQVLKSVDMWVRDSLMSEKTKTNSDSKMDQIST